MVMKMALKVMPTKSGVMSMPFWETGMLLKETRTKSAVMATTSQDQETSFTAALLKTSERTEELDYTSFNSTFIFIPSFFYEF